MANKRFQALKKVQKSKITEKKLSSLIVGEDLYSLLLLWNFWKEGRSNIKLLSKSLIEPVKFLFQGPHEIRGQDNIDIYQKFFDTLEEQVEVPSTFFKDHQFRSFGGRSKHEPLLKEESFYIEPFLNKDSFTHFPFLLDQEFWGFLKSNCETIIFQEIDYDQEKKVWVLEGANGIHYKSENFYWGYGPQVFCRHLKKDRFDASLLEFGESAQAGTCLNIIFELDDSISDRKDTFLIPISLTHEWGHFIGEFTSSDVAMEEGEEKSKKQQLCVRMFLDSQQTSEDEISKRIKILKRSLVKAFPKFSEVSYREYIYLDDNGPSQFIDEEKFSKINTPALPNFIGSNAPLHPSLSKFEFEDDEETKFLKTSHMVRGLLSVKNYSNPLVGEMTS